MSEKLPYQLSVSELIDALSHILAMAKGSRTQTVRIRRIALRAEKAIAGQVFDQEESLSLPMNIRSAADYEHEIRALKREIKSLRNED